MSALLSDFQSELDRRRRFVRFMKERGNYNGAVSVAQVLAYLQQEEGIHVTKESVPHVFMGSELTQSGEGRQYRLFVTSNPMTFLYMHCRASAMYLANPDRPVSSKAALPSYTSLLLGWPSALANLWTSFNGTVRVLAPTEYALANSDKWFDARWVLSQLQGGPTTPAEASLFLPYLAEEFPQVAAQVLGQRPGGHDELAVCSSVLATESQQNSCAEADCSSSWASESQEDDAEPSDSCTTDCSASDIESDGSHLTSESDTSIGSSTSSTIPTDSPFASGTDNDIDALESQHAISCRCPLPSCERLDVSWDGPPASQSALALALIAASSKFAAAAPNLPGLTLLLHVQQDEIGTAIAFATDAVAAQNFTHSRRRAATLADMSTPELQEAHRSASLRVCNVASAVASIDRLAHDLFSPSAVGRMALWGLRYPQWLIADVANTLLGTVSVTAVEAALERIVDRHYPRLQSFPHCVRVDVMLLHGREPWPRLVSLLETTLDTLLHLPGGPSPSTKFSSHHVYSLMPHGGPPCSWIELRYFRQLRAQRYSDAYRRFYGVAPPAAAVAAHSHF